MLHVPPLTNILKKLPSVKSWMQATLYVTFLAVSAIIFMANGMQQMPIMLVIATIPLFIIMDKIKSPIPPIMQFWLLMLIASTCFGFLGVAAIRTVTVDHDRRANDLSLSRDYYDKGFSYSAEDLDRRIVAPHEDLIVKSRNIPKSYPQYRSAILSEITEYNEKEIYFRIDNVVNFFDTVATCFVNSYCSDDFKKYEVCGDLVKFWYLFRPIIEEMRAGAYGVDYARQMQQFAEKIHPPEFRSAVTRDKNSNSINLIYPNG